MSSPPRSPSTETPNEASSRAAELDELDQLDLLSPRAGATEVTGLFKSSNLSATTNAFNTRIQRKKKAQEQALSEAEQQTRTRHTLIIQTLMNIRKSLRDVTRIDLGDRFHLSLVVDDWQGWPRLTVRLNDTLLPQSVYPHFRVVAHDRQGKGTVELSYDQNQPSEFVTLATEGELKRLPMILKKAVRNFLDLTGDIVLEAERKAAAALEDDALHSKSVDAPVETKHTDSDVFLHTDLFSDESPTVQGGTAEVLPTLEQLEQLPLQYSLRLRRIEE